MTIGIKHYIKLNRKREANKMLFGLTQDVESMQITREDFIKKYGQPFITHKNGIMEYLIKEYEGNIKSFSSMLIEFNSRGIATRAYVIHQN